MEGGRRSSTALLILLLALMLAAAASSSTAAAAAQRRQPAADADGSYYKLISVQTSLGDKVKLAMRADGSSVAGFANNRNDWFAIQGSEELLMQPYRDRNGGGGGGSGMPGHGLVTLFGTLVKKNATS